MSAAILKADTDQMLRIGYVNHRSEASKRWIIPVRIEFRVSIWHGADPCWLMIAMDLSKGEVREFLMANIEFNPGE